MSPSFSYSTTFILDKAYFIECYQQTVIQDRTWRAYKKAIMLMVVGLILLMAIEEGGYLTSFLIALGILEALSVRYQQAWWVTRQGLSRAADNEAKLTIDESGIEIHSAFANTVWSWDAIEKLQETSLGWILQHNQTRHYLSNRHLDEQTLHFLAQKAEQIRMKNH